MPLPSPEQQIDFLVKIQRLLGEGRFVASYKFAQIQALADLSVERGGDSGSPLRLTASDIAEKFIQYYWRQTLPLVVPSTEDPSILKQNTGRQAAIISLISRARTKSGGSLARAQSDRKFWQRLTSEVARVVQVMPLWKLQVIGQEVDDFLYPQTGKGPEIKLRPETVFCLRQFHTLIQDLIQGSWVRFVHSIGTNQNLLGETIDLREFLFGSEREGLGVFRKFLMDLQSGECFYCRSRLRGQGDVDHFIPWVKYPVDLGHNFVLVHPSCNRHKREYLAAEDHLHSWVARNDRSSCELSQFFDEKGIQSNLSSSMQITRWAYEQAANSGAHVWVAGDKTKPLGGYWRSWFVKDLDGGLMAAEREPEYE